MTDSAVVDSALVDAALCKSGLISNGDGPTIFKTISYVVSLYCVWAEVVQSSML